VADMKKAVRLRWEAGGHAAAVLPCPVVFLHHGTDEVEGLPVVAVRHVLCPFTLSVEFAGTGSISRIMQGSRKLAFPGAAAKCPVVPRGELTLR